IALTSGFLTSALGTVTVSTPFSIDALTSSIFAFSGSLNLLMNFPLLLSTLCHVSFLSSFSTFLSPLICSTRSSSTSTLTSSFFSPGMSALNTCASGVSFQSILVFTKAEFSPPGMRDEADEGKFRAENGSHASRAENGSVRRLPKKLGISDIFFSKI
ncbi:hypothetical protein LINPERPRIM_LOCUS18089, partial [Linum perenne]